MAPNSTNSETNSRVFHNLVFMKFANNVTILFMLFVYIYADITTTER